MASKAGLFEDLPQPSLAQQVQHTQAEIARRRSEGAVRLLQPNRLQVELRASDLESLLPEDHRARLVWGYVVRQDLSKLIEAVKARGSNAGRAAIDPHILFALWLYATLEGVGSGREVTRLSQEHDAYRWICGGVSVNYHAINDFRAGNATLKDELLKDNVAALAAAGAISLERVAQDGMRVRADAGAASFGRQASLQEHLKEASELVQTLKTQAQTDPGQAKRQAQAAKLRAVDGVKQHVRRRIVDAGHKCILRKFGLVHHDASPTSSEPIPMRKPLTGEPCAGKPHARFGGRGGRCPSLPLSTGGITRGDTRGLTGVTSEGAAGTTACGSGRAGRISASEVRRRGSGCVRRIWPGTAGRRRRAAGRRRCRLCARTCCTPPG